MPGVEILATGEGATAFEPNFLLSYLVQPFALLAELLSV